MIQQTLQKAGVDARSICCDASDKRPLVEADEPNVGLGDGCLVLEKIVKRLC
jgi:hypothetical protein